MGRAGWYQEYHPNYGKGSRVKEGVDQFCVVSGMGCVCVLVWNGSEKDSLK